MDQPDIWELFRLMVFSRRFEEEVKKLWNAGKIFGEMHLGIGEEAINAGVVSQLKEGDALALDHRGTAPLIMRGIDPVKLLLEFLGHPEGLCSGLGGHMHLFSKEHLLASSGIVGASGPTAAGFALAAQYKNMDNIAVAFFGEGAMNQGMMMESMNLASVWNLPVLFVCKDNKLAAATISQEVTGGKLLDRAKGFGINGSEIDGTDVRTVWKVTNEVITEMRDSGIPHFIHAHCEHKEGHLLGDPLLQSLDMQRVGPLIKSMIRIRGTGPRKRLDNLRKILSLTKKAQDQVKDDHDPYLIFRQQLTNESNHQKEIEESVGKKIEQIVEQALEIFQRGIEA